MLAIILVSINTLVLSSVALDDAEYAEEEANHIESDDCCDDDHEVSEYDWASLPNSVTLRATCPACTAIGNNLNSREVVCPGGSKYGNYCWILITYCSRCTYEHLDDYIGPHSHGTPPTSYYQCQKCVNLGCNKYHW